MNRDYDLPTFCRDDGSTQESICEKCNSSGCVVDAEYASHLNLKSCDDCRNPFNQVKWFRQNGYYPCGGVKKIKGRYYIEMRHAEKPWLWAFKDKNVESI